MAPSKPILTPWCPSDKIQTVKRLMPKILALLVMTGLSFSPALAASSPNPTLQGDVNQTCQYIQKTGQVSGCGTSEPAINKSGGLASQIVNTLLYAAGVVSLIFMMIGGIRYITSSGDSSRIQSAKDTLLYAVIGLILTLIALPIAGYVIAKAS